MKNTLKPGDCVSTGKWIIAFIKNTVLLSDGTYTQDSQSLVPVTHDSAFRFQPFAFTRLVECGFVAPTIEEVRVGDALLYFDSVIARLIVIAVVDSDAGVAFDEDGLVIPLGTWSVARTGWRTEEIDLLTDTGRTRLGSIYG